MPVVFRNLFSFRRYYYFEIGNSGITIPTLTVLFHIFLDLLTDNGNEYVLIWDYFGFSHALHLLRAVFRNSFLLRIN